MQLLDEEARPPAPAAAASVRARYAYAFPVWAAIRYAQSALRHVTVCIRMWLARVAAPAFDMWKRVCGRYWPVTAASDTNPHHVFRPREKEQYK